MAFLALFLLIVLIAIILWKRTPMCSFYDDDEEETVTTTTTTFEQPQMNIVGGLKREMDGHQFFVIDPVDGEKVWLNSNDDRYEDANGKIWRLS